jgi:hypothetical protein
MRCLSHTGELSSDMLEWAPPNDHHRSREVRTFPNPLVLMAQPRGSHFRYPPGATDLVSQTKLLCLDNNISDHVLQSLRALYHLTVHQEIMSL